MKKINKKKGEQFSEDIPPESKFLKRAWASRDDQRLNRKSYKMLVKTLIMLDKEYSYSKKDGM